MRVIYSRVTGKRTRAILWMRACLLSTTLLAVGISTGCAKHKKYYSSPVQTIKDLRIEAHAYRYFSPNIPQAHHARQPRFIQVRNIRKVDAGIVPGGLALGGMTHCLPLRISPLPVPDSF